MFVQHVMASNAEIGRTMLDVGGRVGRSYNNKPDIVSIRADHQLSRVGIFPRTQSCTGKQRRRLIEDATFGQRYGNSSCHFKMVVKIHFIGLILCAISEMRGRYLTLESQLAGVLGDSA